MSQPNAEKRLILLTGATGYLGGRLLRVLEEEGAAVRCLARRPEYLASRAGTSTEVVRGDVLDRASLDAAMRGVHTAYYLIHSLGSTGAFEEEERRGALHFAAAAREAGVQRIIYVGGLGRGDLSRHLDSRQTVGRLLRESGVPTIELRASIVIGSGSLSFEMVRALVEKLPVMITPRWTRSLAQPIAIEDLIAYLLQARDIPLASGAVDPDPDCHATVPTGARQRRDEPGGSQPGRVFEIGGADVVSYRDLMREYARQRGLRRWVLPVPVLTPRLSSWWLGLVTPLYARIGRKLIDSVRNDTIVTNDAAGEAFDIRPRGMADAIARALTNEDHRLAETRWSDALSSRGALSNWGGVRFGPRIVDSRTIRVTCDPATAFAPVERIGGRTGWYYADFLWRLRGFLDLLVGGVGTRRGRRDPHRLVTGDAVDFWRVEACERPRLLRLAAEMKVPGRAWLQFEVDGHGDDSVIRQTAIFDPAGLGGLLYWYALYPLHGIVFRGMLRGIATAALRPPASRRAAPVDAPP